MTTWFRLAMLAAAFAACDDKLQGNPAAAALSASASAHVTATPKFDAYESFATEKRRTDPTTLPAGDVALAKGRRIAPIELHAQHRWSAMDQADIDSNSEIRRLTNVLSKARAPFCGGAWENCVGKPWYADDPASAGVVLYVDRKTDVAGTYHVAGSDTASATGYETVLTFTAVLVPENVRVARWARYCPAPLKSPTVGGKAMMQSGMVSAADLDDDMKTLGSGAVPKGNLTIDALDATDAGAPRK